MIRRVFLFVLTNIGVIIAASIIFMIVERVFGIQISGYFNGNYMGLAIFAIIYGFVGSFFSLSISRWIAKKTYGIQPISSDIVASLSKKEQLVYRTVQQIALQNNIQMPEVGIYGSREPNAFATGPSKNKSLVAVSTGLIEVMTDSEIEGVVAHEMAHILNGDMVTMTLLQGVINAFVIFFARIVAQVITSALRDEGRGVGVFAYYGIVIALEILFGFIGMTILMAYSRWREFRADAGSAKYVGREKMIAALQRLESIKVLGKSKKSISMDAAKISDRRKFAGIFASHPPLSKRIERLSQSAF